MTQIAKGFRGDMANGFDPSRIALLDEATAGHVERRRRLLGPAYRLFYNTPVAVSRGKGALLYDRDGNEYLDAYNNVASLGHCHPSVVDAIRRQSEILCTHTRYMQDGVLDYAEQLLSTFAGSIGRSGCAMFTCTGSEANDLALRIAQHHTGKTGVIVTSEAYHGNSGLGAGISPSLGKRSRLAPYTRTVQRPDSYREDKAQIGQRTAREVAAQIEDIERHGGGIAAFIADSVFSSDGLYGDPTDILAPVAEVVRRAGGLFIADEVQSGFGRTGSMWGHERHGVDPDIVTLGKPMGNGYPVAGVLLRQEVVKSFGESMRYFNTFGGNTVAIAAAQATLNVIRDENLLDRCQRSSATMLDGLRDIADRYEKIGDVRGVGLYFAVEMVKDRTSKEPDMDAALAAVNGLRERRILISATGPDASILKIRPPLVFEDAHVGRFLDGLDKTMRNLH